VSSASSSRVAVTWPLSNSSIEGKFDILVDDERMV